MPAASVVNTTPSSISTTSDTATSDMSFDNLPGDSDDGVGLTDPHLSHGRRRMLDLINRLHSTGVQVDLDLPTIAVIGNQSAGKSSLIESISGVTLPRAAGTCTRCPTECKLSYSNGSWVCKVSLRFITDKKGQTLGQVRNETFGPPITNRAEVEQRIRRAQRAVLNPSLPSDHFLHGDDEDREQNELTFSLNCVSLQISGKEIADLSFVDLPGLIATVSKDADANDIQLVQSLVTSYIRKENCIILLAVACETDFENQGAHQLAKKYDANGARTVGVLTKPDRIQEGEHEQWLPFIRNTKEPLQNNWFCVKQPSPKRLKEGITWKQARKEEDDFFSSSAPWSSLESTHQQLLRTQNLTQRLSFILSDLITKRLPKIQEELQQLMTKTDEALRQLPRPPSNDPQGEVFQLLATFTRDLARHLEGTTEEDGLLQQINPAQRDFRRRIRATAPDFHPYEQRHSGSKSMPPLTFLEKEEDSDHVDSDEEDHEHLGEKAPAKVAHKGSDRNRMDCDPTAIYLDEVSSRAAKSLTRELPGIYPFVVHKSFITDVIKNWRQPCLGFFESVKATVNKYVKDVLKSHFESFGNGSLYNKVAVVFNDHIRAQAEKTEIQLKLLLQLESCPYTANTHYYADYQAKFLSYYRSLRRKHSNPQFTDNVTNHSRNDQTFGKDALARNINAALAALAQAGLHGLKAEDLTRLMPPDPYEEALKIMASVRAYFQVAYKRFTDYVPMLVDQYFIRGVESDLQQTLRDRLGIGGLEGHKICKELVEENPTVSAHREELLKKRERLRVASAELLGPGRI